MGERLRNYDGMTEGNALLAIDGDGMWVLRSEAEERIAALEAEKGRPSNLASDVSRLLAAARREGAREAQAAAAECARFYETGPHANLTAAKIRGQIQAMDDDDLGLTRPSGTVAGARLEAAAKGKLNPFGCCCPCAPQDTPQHLEGCGIAALEAERDNAIHALMLDQQEARREGARDLAEGLREALFPSGRVYTAEKAGWVSLMVTKFDAALGKLKVDPPQEWREKHVMDDDNAALGEVDGGAKEVE